MNAAAAGRPITSALSDTEFVQKPREGELYDLMAPLLWCAAPLMLVCCSARALPGCSPGPRKSTTNSEQPAVDPLVLLTFGPLRRCRYATDIVTVELAADDTLPAS